MNRYIELKWLLQEGKIKDLKLQPVFKFVVEYHRPEARTLPITKKMRYIADFQYVEPSGKVVVEDVKGLKTKEFLRKKKLFEYFYSEYELRLT